MGFLCAAFSIFAVLLIVCTASRWDNRAAYRLLQSSQHLFEPESEAKAPVLPDSPAGRNAARP